MLEIVIKIFYRFLNTSNNFCKESLRNASNLRIEIRINLRNQLSSAKSSQPYLIIHNQHKNVDILRAIKTSDLISWLKHQEETLNLLYKLLTTFCRGHKIFVTIFFFYILLSFSNNIFVLVIGWGILWDFVNFWYFIGLDSCLRWWKSRLN